MDDRDLYEAGRSKMAAGALEEAIASFQQSAALYPHFKTLELLGECHSRLGQWTQAVIPLAAATSLNQQSRAPSLLAEVFERLGELDKAAEMASVTLERDPANTPLNQLTRFACDLHDAARIPQNSSA